LEIKKAATLQPLLHLHPNWPCFEKLLNEGSNWPLEEIPELSRAKDVKEAFGFGNHKGASFAPELLTLLVNNNVVLGFAVPFPLKKMHKIPGILFAHLNIQEQNTINSTEWIVPLMQLTHGQSYKWLALGTSINSCTRKDKLLPCIYGGVVPRLVNWTVAAQQKYPTTRIYATKIDFKQAYCHLHVSYKIAKQCCTQLPPKEIVLMALCLTFGGTPCPFKWGAILETICDLATALLLDNDWDPTNLHAPNQANFPPKKISHQQHPFCRRKGTNCQC
jgi:hypothetical protein